MAYGTDFYPLNPGLGSKLQGEGGSEVDQAYLAHYAFTPGAKSATAVHADIPLTATAQTITTGITQPDVPRCLTIKGDDAGMVGNVVLTGTDFAGAALTETIALNAATEVVGTKAFKTLTSIQVPAQTAAGNNVSIGRADKFGLPHKLLETAAKLMSLFNGTTEAGTFAKDTVDLCKNLYTPVGVPDGAKVINLVYIVD